MKHTGLLTTCAPCGVIIQTQTRFLFVHSNSLPYRILTVQPRSIILQGKPVKPHLRSTLVIYSDCKQYRGALFNYDGCGIWWCSVRVLLLLPERREINNGSGAAITSPSLSSKNDCICHLQQMAPPNCAPLRQRCDADVIANALDNTTRDQLISLSPKSALSPHQICQSDGA